MASVNLTLDRLPSGQPARIVEAPSKPVPLCERLQELGLTVGELVEVTGRGILGDPIFLCLNDTQLALRQTEAKWILVEKL